jgi:hypothetical protein
MTPPKIYNSKVTDTWVREMEGRQRTQKHDYKNDQQSERGHV